MLELELILLTGRYAATAYNDRSMAEWPPHPARVFSALVDALHDSDHPNAIEAEVLDRIAAAEPPQIHASEAHERRVMTSFVPVNDTALTDVATLRKREEKLLDAQEAERSMPNDAGARVQKTLRRAVEKAAAGLLAAATKEALPPRKLPSIDGSKVLPWGRTKQPRTFPVAIPHDARIVFRWSDLSLSPEEMDALELLTRRVARVGHSSSFVLLRPVDNQTVEPDWVPDPDGDTVLRVPQQGQRVALETAWGRHRGEVPGRVLPARHVRYGAVSERVRAGTTVWSRGRWIAFHLLGSTQPPGAAAVAVADAVRRALVGASSPEPLLTGRTADGPVHGPHLAVLPLPFVGKRHADGAIRGFALALPEVDEATEQILLRAVGVWENGRDTFAIPYGRTELTVQRIVDPAESLWTLNRFRWRGPARTWATMTPIALDGECDPLNHPKGSVRRKAHKTAARLVRKAIVRAVSAPDQQPLQLHDIDLTLLFDAPVVGAPHLRRVPPYKRPGHRRPRRLVHALFSLPFRLRGPLLVGSGRHHGLGLCAPVED